MRNTSNSVIVTKFGGSVFTDEAAYHAVAAQLCELAMSYQHVVAVVSARKGRSNELIREVASSDHERLNDMLKGSIDPADPFNNYEVARLLVRGEEESVEMLVDAGNARGGLIQFEGRVQTDENFPVIANVNPLRGKALINSTWAAARTYPLSPGVTVLAGYGGRSVSGDVCLLGRNASDVVAAMAAYGFDAEVLRFYKDVDGIFARFGTSDQRLIEKISRTELAAMGSLKVLDERVLRAPYEGNIEIMRFGAERPGTIITPTQEEVELYANQRGIEERISA